MLITDFFFALFAATVFSVVVAVFFGWRHPAQPDSGIVAALGFSFLTIFLAAIVGSTWIRPIASLPWGGGWLPALGISLLVASIIMASGAPRVPRRPAVSENVERRRAEAVAKVFGGFFWLMVLGFVTALVLGSVL
ncbi:MAG: hypothetical protein V2I67_18630 [Thermoanaerobaculales bacterium]|nr:hypothetical protein [Thermoanaerobaculales bacterium]